MSDRSPEDSTQATSAANKVAVGLSDEPAPVRRIAKSIFNNLWVQAVVWAAAMGALVNFGNQGKGGLIPGGYTAGFSDHLVLAPLGMQWADPSKFANDWFMQVSPQPHWFFDIVTFLGASVGNVAAAYFVFWLVGLFAFGLATALLARKWAPGFSWLLGAGVTLIMSLAPWASVGTGNAMISFVVPAVVGGHMVFLFLALINTGHLRAAAIFAPFIAVVHVQQGAVICVIILALIVMRFFTEKRTIWTAGIATLLVTGGVVFFDLMFRPVAAKLQDFVNICNTMIPYHCAASTWSAGLIYSSIGLIGLSALTFFYVLPKQRWIWAASIGLPALGLILGMLADHYQVPLVGALAQATNIYRLGALIFPFAIFGMLVGLFRASWTWRSLAIFLAGLFLTYLYLGQDGWQMARPTGLAFILVLIAATAIVFVSQRRRGNLKKWVTRLGVALFLAAFLTNAVVGKNITPRPLSIEFINNADERAWGQAVEKLVPSGEQILAAPQWDYVRISTSRAVIADCKNVPYGGAAWEQWQERIKDLGGIDQCRPPFTQTYGTFSGQEFNALAQKYSTNYLILDVLQTTQIRELEGYGWKVIMTPFNKMQGILMTNR